MPPMPAGVREGILRGAYRFRSSAAGPSRRPGMPRVRLLGSGAIMNEVLEAQRMLAESYGIESEVWAVTSYQQLFREALEAERANRLSAR